MSGSLVIDGSLIVSLSRRWPLSGAHLNACNRPLPVISKNHCLHPFSQTWRTWRLGAPGHSPLPLKKAAISHLHESQKSPLAIESISITKPFAIRR